MKLHVVTVYYAHYICRYLYPFYDKIHVCMHCIMYTAVHLFTIYIASYLAIQFTLLSILWFINTFQLYDFVGF